MMRNAEDRRDFLRNTALAALLGAVPEAASQEVHHHAAEAKSTRTDSTYKPAELGPEEYRVVGILADIIIPPEGNDPGGKAAGAPEYIDLLCSGADEMAQLWHGGLAWLEAQARRQHGLKFAELNDQLRRELLDSIAYRKNATPETSAGVRFFALARQMVVDAWATSSEGTKILGYKGNVGMQTFQVPESALNYALARSPFKER